MIILEDTNTHTLVSRYLPELRNINITLKDTIRGFKGIMEGEYDHLPEQAFYMVGSIDEAVEKAKKL